MFLSGTRAANHTKNFPGLLSPGTSPIFPSCTRNIFASYLGNKEREGVCHSVPGDRLWGVERLLGGISTSYLGSKEREWVGHPIPGDQKWGFELIGDIHLLPKDTLPRIGIVMFFSDL